MKESIRRSKKIIVHTLLLFLLISGIFLVASIFYLRKTNEIKLEALVKNEETMIRVESNIALNKMDSLISDLLYLSNTYRFHYNGAHSYIDLETEWSTFVELKNVYDQIRFIDVNGDEKVRINFSEEGAQIVQKVELQNKKDRDYFKQAINLKENQVLISKLDLNVENNIVEVPIKPMLRLATPIYDEEEFLGIVVTNYYADYLLKTFKETAAAGIGDYFLINSEGDWIVNTQDAKKEWSFMYEDRSDISFKNEYPEEWEQIQDNSLGVIQTEHGFFIYHNILEIMEHQEMESVPSNEDIVLEDESLIAISYISNATASKANIYISFGDILLSIIQSKGVLFIIFLGIAVMIAVLLAIARTAQEKIRYFSEVDEMTGAYNRRTGYTLLKRTYHKADENNEKFSICFIDINGLKEVNDNLGHEAGDELILSIVAGIKKCIRQFDYLIRLGGDEFLIILQDTGEEQAEVIWSRILEEYELINRLENRKYLVSASHGVVEYDSQSKIMMDEIINSADKKMYDEKRKMKGEPGGFSSVRNHLHKS